MGNLINNLIYTTVRFEVLDSTATKTISTGTGFFMNFNKDDSGNKVLSAIVTNKHVIKDAKNIAFHVSLSDQNGNEIKGTHQRIVIYDMYNNGGVFFHKDKDVDVVAMVVAPTFSNLTKSTGKKPFVKYISMSMTSNQEYNNSLFHIEDVIMIGYPIGIWDSVNNKPVVRKGITASSLSEDWEGKPVFLTDIATIGGSSGSPIFLYSTAYADKEGGYNLGTRIKLVGIHYAGARANELGELIEVKEPEKIKIKSMTQIPINLGFAHHARVLKDIQSDIYTWLEELEDKLK